MSTWWYVIVILALVALGLLYLRYRRNHAGISDAGSRNGDRRDSTLPARDFTQEREADRVGHMTAEDRTWEAASIGRNRAAGERDQTPPMHR
jgi:LPXTG-motif cell wall-anchored protein